MTKFKKEYDHKNEDTIEACGFEENSFMDIVFRGVNACEQTDNLSEAVEKIENYCHEYDPEMFHRFLIIQFVSYLALKNKEVHQNSLKQMLNKVLGNNAEKILVFEEDGLGNLEHIESLNRSDDPKLFDKITQKTCNTCDKKDECKHINNTEDECSSVIKH